MNPLNHFCYSSLNPLQLIYIFSVNELLEKLNNPGVILVMFSVYMFVNAPKNLLQLAQKYKLTVAFLPELVGLQMANYKISWEQIFTINGHVSRMYLH